MSAETAITAAFDAAGVAGRLHAVDLDHGAEVAVGDPDELVVQASIFKIPILVELLRQCEAGTVAADVPIALPADRPRTPGGLGTSAMLDDLAISPRDLALLMMSVSDNHATDVLLDLVGLDAVNATMRDHGFPRTQLVGDCADLYASMAEDLGRTYDEHVRNPDRDPGWARVRAMRAVTPAQTSHTTMRETSALLTALWRDERFSPGVCAEARRILGLQAWPHRLAAGFPGDRIRVSGKTGTIAHLRCEAGVVEHPDGSRIAVGVFVASPTPDARNPVADRVIGDAASIAVAELRDRR